MMSLILFIFSFFAFGLSEENIFSELNKKLSKQTNDYIELKVERKEEKKEGEKARKILLSGVMSLEANYDLIFPIFEKKQDYKRWFLKNINQKPSGGMFRVQILDIEVLNLNHLRFLWGIQISFFKKEGKRTFDIRTEKKSNYIKLSALTLPGENDWLFDLDGNIYFYRSPVQSNRVWLYVDGYIVLPMVLYTLMPNDLLQRELKERVEVIYRNYLEEEDRVFKSQMHGKKTGY